MPKKLRSEELWVDCVAARREYEAAKRRIPGLFKLLQDAAFGSGALGRIQGQSAAGAPPLRYRAMQKGSIEKFAEICRIQPNILLVDGTGLRPPQDENHETSKITSSLPIPIINIVPLPGLNFVRGVEDNYEPNDRFFFTVQFNIMSGPQDCLLTGFEALYSAPDGCYCFNSDYQLRVAGQLVTVSANDISFTQAVSIASNSMVQLTYKRFVRPPLQIQVPADCDYGDLHVRYRFYISGAEHNAEKYFRFEIGGDLTLTGGLREPPILPDSVLRRALERGVITNEEFELAMNIDAVHRYQILAFPERHEKLLREPHYSSRMKDLYALREHEIEFLENLHNLCHRNGAYERDVAEAPEKI